MKQTAVEWLVEEMINKGFFDANKQLTFTNLDHLQNQAKEMEKEQMRAASCPYIGGWEEGEFEYWYNEKFKK